MTIRWQPKRPDEARDYAHDWSAFLGSDTIASQVSTANGVSLDSTDVAGQVVTFRVSGGADGIARVTHTITSSGGRVETETFILPVTLGEPVSLAEAKEQIRDLSDFEDALIEQKIRSAREWVEEYTGLILVRRTVEDPYSAFGPYLSLYSRPVVDGTVVVTYTDSAGLSASYANPVVRSSRLGVRIYPAASSWWPSLNSNGEVIVSYTAGFDEGKVPEKAIEAILVLVAGMLSEREGAYQVSVRTAESLCDPYRMVTV